VYDIMLAMLIAEYTNRIVLGLNYLYMFFCMDLKHFDFGVSVWFNTLSRLNTPACDRVCFNKCPAFSFIYIQDFRYVILDSLLIFSCIMPVNE